MLLSQEGRVAISIQLLLRLPHQCVQSRFHVRQFLSDMGHEHLSIDEPLRAGSNIGTHRIQSLGQEFCPAPMRDVPVNRVILEELLLFPPGIIHRYFRNDILLTPIDHTHKS